MECKCKDYKKNILKNKKVEEQKIRKIALTQSCYQKWMHKLKQLLCWHLFYHSWQVTSNQDIKIKIYYCEKCGKIK
jgi:hypothetical protein